MGTCTTTGIDSCVCVCSDCTQHRAKEENRQQQQEEHRRRSLVTAGVNLEQLEREAKAFCYIGAESVGAGNGAMFSIILKSFLDHVRLRIDSGQPLGSGFDPEIEARVNNGFPHEQCGSSPAFETMAPPPRHDSGDESPV